MLKNTLGFLLTLGCGFVHAGAMGVACQGDQITMPCVSKAWDFGLRALYLQPYFGGLLADRNYSTAAGTDVTAGIGTKWNWGGMIEGTYHFETGRDVYVNWYHLDTSRQSVSYGTGAMPAIIAGFSDSSTVTLDKVFSHLNARWDTVNFEFGQAIFFDSTNARRLRLYGGAGYFRLDGDSTVSFDGVRIASGSPSPYSTIRVTQLSYNGIGPRVGLNMNYAWDDGLGVYVDGGTALYLGASKYSDYESSTTVTASGSDTLVVPDLEGKLGVNYSFTMAKGTMKIDAGWLWINYIGPLAKPSTTVLENPTHVNFTISGPYIGFNWRSGNLA